MGLLHSWVVKKRTLVVALVLAGVVSGTAFAQGAPSLVETVISLFEELTTDVEAVQSSVDAVQESFDASGATSNIKVTPAVIVQSGILDCVAVNVADTDREIGIQVVDSATGDNIIDWSSVIVAPGRRTGIGLFSPSAFAGLAFCRFIVTGGTKADIRGSLLLTPNIGGDDTTSVAVSAE